jgi:hypothetical protein
MATQYQVAYSKDVIGAGIVAAGPWFCAQGSLLRALGECMEGELAAASGSSMAPRTRSWARP